MGDLFRDTVFGHAVRLVSRNKYLAWDDGDLPVPVNKSVASQISETTSGTDSSVGLEKTSSGESAARLDAKKLEKGDDIYLVEWAENDPKVRRVANNVVTMLPLISLFLGSFELVPGEKSFRRL